MLSYLRHIPEYFSFAFRPDSGTILVCGRSHPLAFACLKIILTIIPRTLFHLFGYQIRTLHCVLAKFEL
jgi:hypothetical protein